jgi:hypothetical protein
MTYGRLANPLGGGPANADRGHFDADTRRACVARGHARRAMVREHHGRLQLLCADCLSRDARTGGRSLA